MLSSQPSILTLLSRCSGVTPFAFAQIISFIQRAHLIQISLQMLSFLTGIQFSRLLSASSSLQSFYLPLVGLSPCHCFLKYGINRHAQYVLLGIFVQGSMMCSVLFQMLLFDYILNFDVFFLMKRNIGFALRFFPGTETFISEYAIFYFLFYFIFAIF